MGKAGQGMAQTTSLEAARIARSDTLTATLLRATDYAAGQSHAGVTLEHLLLALTEDDDAVGVLTSSTVDVSSLRNQVAAFIGQQPPTLPQGMRPGPDADHTKILTYAEAAARQSGRTEINGAIVLAAIVGEGRSMAATFLKAQGLTFQAAIKYIQQVLAPEPPPAPAPAPEPAPATEARAEPAPSTPAPSEAEAAPSADAEPTIAPWPAETGEEPVAPPRPEPRPEPKRETSDAAVLPDTRVPPVQKPLWEPVGIPNIRAEPPTRVPVPPRKAVEPRDPPPAPPERAAPPAKETAAERAPPPEPAPTRGPDGPAPAAPAAAAPSQPVPPPPRALTTRPLPAPSIGDPAIPRGPAPGATGRPPPIPAGRGPGGPPPIPPPAPAPAGGLGAARPPPPRPGLRLPPTAGEGHQITAPWPDPNDARPPPPAYPPPPAPGARAPVPELDHRAARPGMPPPMTRGQAPPGRPAAIEQGQLIENIPRRMKVGVADTFEVRIARDGIDAGRGLAGRGLPHAHALLITRAMSVRLQGEPGRFYIEASSPETQWTGSRNEHLTSDYAVWRFTVIPQRRGPAELTLVVSARTIGSDGVVADTSLPEQRISIRVSANLTRGLKRWAGWAAVALLGAALGKIGESFWEQGLTLLRRLLAI